MTKVRSDKTADLRRRAEEKARSTPQTVETLSLDETRQTLHELQVHQIELDMQNEELRRAQVELEASRARYVDLYDLAPVGYFTISEQGLIIETNLTAAKLFGVARGDLLQRPLTHFIVADDQDIYYRHRKQLFETGEPQASEMWMQRADAPPFWARLDSTAAQDVNGSPVCRIILIDITERKQAQDALKRAHDQLEDRVKERTIKLAAANTHLRSEIAERKQAELDRQESEEKFRVAFENASVGMVMVAGDCRITQANAAFARMTGYSQKELSKMSVLDITLPEERDPIRLGVQQAMAGIVSHFAMEKHYVGKRGNVFWGQASVAAVHRTDGEVSFLLGIIEDITTRKNVQEALEDELENMRNLLRASDQDRQLIVHEIHDELAQQLTGAIMQLQTFEALKETEPQLAADAYREGMALLHRGHQETRRLIAGVRPLILDESGVVAAIAHIANEQNGHPGPTIEYRSEVHFDRLPPALENAIYRIVQEAVNNACRHSKSPKVRVSLVQRGDRLRIKIQDWGIGFDLKEPLENQFGLEGVRQRARLLDGVCSLHSVIGKGTTVTVELPLPEVETDPCMAAVE